MRLRRGVFANIAAMAPAAGGGGAAPPSQSDLVLWLTAADLSKLFQTITGTTAVASDGDVVGTWKDSSSAAFDLNASANDSTRPVFHTSAGVNWVTFDGSNDVLKRAASVLGFGGTQDCTFVIAVRPGTPSGGARLFSANNTSTGNPLYNPICAGSTPADWEYYIRDDSSGSKAGVMKASGLVNNTDAVLLLTDDYNGADHVFTPYVDGVSSATKTETLSGSYTWNHFSLGALYSGSFLNFFSARIYGMLIYNKVLNSTEIAAATTYMGSLQGRSI